jgi:hypothetical protein
MNGNAIYCLNDPEWRKHRSAVQAFYKKDNPPATNAPGLTYLIFHSEKSG